MLGSVGLAMMISGALGNAIDRFMYSTGFYDGYVRDFIGVKYFAIFNVADSCMCVGIAILLISMLFSIRKGRSTTPKPKPKKEPPLPKNANGKSSTKPSGFWRVTLRRKNAATERRIADWLKFCF